MGGAESSRLRAAETLPEGVQQEDGPGLSVSMV